MAPYQSSDYEHVKEAILKAYDLVPDAYRQKFRNYMKNDICEGKKEPVQ